MADQLTFATAENVGSCCKYLLNSLAGAAVWHKCVYVHKNHVPAFVSASLTVHFLLSVPCGMAALEVASLLLAVLSILFIKQALMTAVKGHAALLWQLDTASRSVREMNRKEEEETCLCVC
eukprot:1158009-Pelagomonas_calceolata.AAC.8